MGAERRRVGASQVRRAQRAVEKLEPTESTDERRQRSGNLAESIVRHVQRVQPVERRQIVRQPREPVSPTQQDSQLRHGGRQPADVGHAVVGERQNFELRELSERGGGQGAQSRPLRVTAERPQRAQPAQLRRDLDQRVPVDLQDVARGRRRPEEAERKPPQLGAGQNERPQTQSVEHLVVELSSEPAVDDVQRCQDSTIDRRCTCQ